MGGPKGVERGADDADQLEDELFVARVEIGPSGLVRELEQPVPPRTHPTDRRGKPAAERRMLLRLRPEALPGRMGLDLGLRQPDGLTGRDLHAVETQASRVDSVVAPPLVGGAEAEVLARRGGIVLDVEIERGLLGSGQRPREVADSSQQLVEALDELSRAGIRPDCQRGCDLGSDLTGMRHGLPPVRSEASSTQAFYAVLVATETALWHSQAHMPTVKSGEIVIARGEGAYLWDEDGRRYLDTSAGLWYCNVGHGRVEIADAVARQMRTLETYHTFQQFATRPALELAARVAELVPIPNAKVFLGSGGSDAIDTAGKLARRYWSALGKPEKRTIVTRERGYHGLHALGTSIVGLELNREGLGELVPDTVRVPANDAAALESLVERRGAGTVAAFFAEPIIGTGGVIHPAPGYFDEVQRICREHEILLVTDEVVCGFGRTGEWFATGRFGIEPDMMVIAKGITSGYLPLGGVVVGERVWAPFWEDGSELVFRHGLTYSGHTSVCAAAMTNLDILEREELIARVRELEPVLEQVLRPLESHDLVAEVRTGIGLLGGVQLHDPSVAQRVANAMLERGAIGRTLPDGVIHVSPPFVVSEDDLRFLGDALAESLEAAKPVGATAA